MSAPLVASRELGSWKEIASYLGVSVRTAQVWERERGLPVRRVPGGHGRVAIDVVALEEWKRSATPASANRRVLWSARLFVGAAAVLLAVVLVAVFLLGHGRRPSGIRVRDNVLTVLDARERVLWTKTFDHALSPGDSLTGLNWARPRFWIGDLQGDGRTEVLFVDMPTVHGDRSHVLICYSERGEELWRFTPGKIVTTTTASFAPPFTVLRFLVAPMGRGRPNSIVVSSGQFLQYPTQVALLSNKGSLVREYWHAGRFTEIGIADLDGDGINEIYLGGVNNARHQATLVVLDPDKFTGASNETPNYQLQGFGTGVERARLLFPRSCINRALETYNVVSKLWISPTGLTIDVHEGLAPTIPVITYQLDQQLRLLRATPSDTFRSTHAALYTNKQLDHSLNAADEQAMQELRNIAVPSRR